MAIIKLSGASKKGQDMLIKAHYNLGDTLRSIYRSWSETKEKEYNKCRRECYEDKGHDFRIISRGGSWKFSVAWNYTNPDTGEVMTKIKTADNTYIIDGSRKEN